MNEHTLPFLSSCLLFLCLLIVLCPNPLQFHHKSFSFQNKIPHLSLCLSHSFSSYTFVLSSLPLFSPFAFFCFFHHVPLMTPLSPSLSFIPFCLSLNPFLFLLTAPTHFLCLYRLPVWNRGMGWDHPLQSGGRGRASEARWCAGLYLDHQGSSSV